MKMLREICATALILGLVGPALALDAHHPADAPAAATAPAAPTLSPPKADQQPGMMGMMGGAGCSMEMMQMMAPERVDARLAELAIALKISPARAKDWEAFAAALRANARGMSDAMSMMQGGMQGAGGGMPRTTLGRIEMHEHLMSARLDALRQVKAALKVLYAGFDEQQRETADRLLMPGMMGAM